MSEKKLIDAMKVVTERYKTMGVEVDQKTLAVLVVNHAIGDYRRYRGDSEYWAMVDKVETLLEQR